MSIIGTKQWAPENENCCEGCRGDCRYCYAKKKAIRFKRRTKENWHEVKPNKRSARPVKKHDGRVMFPTTHDLHWDTKMIWFPFLKKLLEVGNEVLIVSKPDPDSIELICQDLFRFRDQIEFRFTIGTHDDETRKFWEPGAPAIPDRIRALKIAHAAGFKTSISMEPLLVGDPEQLIGIVKPYVTGEIWIGMMNHMSIKDFQDEGSMIWYQKMSQINSLDNILKVHAKFRDDPRIRWKDSIQDLLGLPKEKLP